MKKAYMRTLEAFIAASFSIVILIYFISVGSTASQLITPEKIIPQLYYHEEFRNCIVADNESCLHMLIESILPRTYNYITLITEDSHEIPSLPEQSVVVESLMIAGNGSTYDPKIIRIYYWKQ